MNYIELKGNNGSVPNPYFKQFNLFLFEDGSAKLDVINGRESESTIVESETKKVSPEKVSELIMQSQLLGKNPNHSVIVGGPEKIIDIKFNGKIKTFIINTEKSSEFEFFFECLQLYDNGLEKRLADLL
jgi:hypothetical protein